LTASFNAAGQLQINAQPGFEFSFSDDSSGALALMGVNTLFTGSSALDIGVRQAVMDDPSLLMVGRFENGTLVENGTALGVSSLREQAVAGLGGVSASRFWSDSVEAVASKASIARTNADAGRSCGRASRRSGRR
jgi:flagellar hook-associated protein FlgK